jgi:hypothetical protein
MEDFDLDIYVRRSRALDLSDIPWDDVRRHPMSPQAVRTPRYMQDIESHTIGYLRTLLSTRAIDDPEVATFLACWLMRRPSMDVALGGMDRSRDPGRARSRSRDDVLARDRVRVARAR